MPTSSFTKNFNFNAKEAKQLMLALEKNEKTPSKHINVKANFWDKNELKKHKAELHEIFK